MGSPADFRGSGSKRHEVGEDTDQERGAHAGLTCRGPGTMAPGKRPRGALQGPPCGGSRPSERQDFGRLIPRVASNCLSPCPPGTPAPSWFWAPRLLCDYPGDFPSPFGCGLPSSPSRSKRSFSTHCISVSPVPSRPQSHLPQDPPPHFVYTALSVLVTF